MNTDKHGLKTRRHDSDTCDRDERIVDSAVSFCLSGVTHALNLHTRQMPLVRPINCDVKSDGRLVEL